MVNCTLCRVDVSVNLKEQEDDTILFINNDIVHQKCLHCKDCGVSLTDTCFKAMGGGGGAEYYLCQKDFYNRSCSPTCSTCDSPIVYNQLAIPFGEKRFHVDCVTCSVCKIIIKKGQNISFEDGKLVCEQHVAAITKVNLDSDN